MVPALLRLPVNSVAEIGLLLAPPTTSSPLLLTVPTVLVPFVFHVPLLLIQPLLPILTSPLMTPPALLLTAAKLDDVALAETAVPFMAVMVPLLKTEPSPLPLPPISMMADVLLLPMMVPELLMLTSDELFLPCVST